VDSVDESYTRMTERGVQFARAPAAQFWGYGAELADPEGYRVRLWDGPR
jgi:predicted enzyme related to lactoylglutathione lyase